MNASKRWNPRFVAFARSNGNTPDEQIESDKLEWPGGHMAGFIVWISKQWWTWAREENETRRWGDHWSDEQHARFDAWLQERF